MDKRVLYVTAVFPPAGVPEADHSLHQCLHLARRGYDVHVLTTVQPDVADPESLTVHAIMKDWSWRELPKLWRVLRSVKPHVTMLFFLGTLFHYSTMITFLPLFAKLARPGCRCIAQFSSFGAGGPASSHVRRLVFRLLGPLRYGSLLVATDRFVVLGELHGQMLAKMHPRAGDRAQLIPPPPLLPMADDPGEARARGRERLGVAGDDFLVAFFGRMYPGKGIEQMVEAVRRLADEWPQLRLALIGGFLSSEHYWNTSTNYAQELRESVERAGLGDRVVWSGEYAWDSTEGSDYLFASDLVVLPLKVGVHLNNSSFAAVCAHGLPAVVTAGEIVESPLRHGENVFLIEEQDPNLISGAIREIGRDEELRRRLQEGSCALAGEWFDWDRATDRLTELFELEPANGNTQRVPDAGATRIALETASSGGAASDREGPVS